MGLKELILFLERPLPTDESLVQTSIAVLHSIPLMAFDCSVELFVGVVQFGGCICHSGKGRTQVVEVVA